MSWGHLIDDRPDEGVFRVHRDAFRDPAVFAQEMVQFFERGWVFVGHASQIPHPHDYITVRVGRNPVIISRDDQGNIHALHNSCRHKGAVVCQHSQGNRRAHLCPYHGWSYASDGRNLLIKDKAEGDYAPSFDTNNHDLQAAARFAQYRGFMFASLSGDVPPLEEHLGDVRTLIDLAVDQAPDGLELVPGVVHYRFQANWKLQLENTVDAYHFASTHPSYLRLLERRASMPERADAPQTIWQSQNKPKEMMGSFGFAHGHAMVWTTTPVENHPLFDQREQLQQRVGALRTQWMMRTDNSMCFPICKSRPVRPSKCASSIRWLWTAPKSPPIAWPRWVRTRTSAANACASTKTSSTPVA